MIVCTLIDCTIIGHRLAIIIYTPVSYVFDLTFFILLYSVYEYFIILHVQMGAYKLLCHLDNYEFTNIVMKKNA